MKKNVKILFVQLLLLATVIFPNRSSAQITKVINTQVGTMKLSGTSTMHDWDMNGMFQVSGNFKVAEGSNKLQSVSGLNFVLPVENLKSDKRKLDETAYKALKTEQYKDIYFKMTSSTITELQSNRYKITAHGNLTIAGVTKPITMEVFWVVNADQTISCAGIQKLKMTDFKVEPPSFLGFMKTGDDISLDFVFQFKS